MHIVIKHPDYELESDKKKSDDENLKDGLSSREEMERYGYGKRERIKNNSTK